MRLLVLLLVIALLPGCFSKVEWVQRTGGDPPGPTWVPTCPHCQHVVRHGSLVCQNPQCRRFIAWRDKEIFYQIAAKDDEYDKEFLESLDDENGAKPKNVEVKTTPEEEEQKAVQDVLDSVREQEQQQDEQDLIDAAPSLDVENSPAAEDNKESFEDVGVEEQDEFMDDLEDFEAYDGSESEEEFLDDTDNDTSNEEDW